ncbi:hypothetical protein AB0N07_41875 [Streptomyces sp. NPDC051172]|uniref:LppU/SCO3897 family protein n=1 Tax=Streptomyces sp. NPDC051172 TaxID=3155796 RepID=UPI003423AA12
MRVVKAVAMVVVLFGGVGYYVWDYNTSPTGGKARAAASASASAAAHDPGIGDCVKVKDPKGEPVTTVVDCNSPEAEYKLGEMVPGANTECGSKYDYGIQTTAGRAAARCASPRSDLGRAPTRDLQRFCDSNTLKLRAGESVNFANGCTPV